MCGSAVKQIKIDKNKQFLISYQKKKSLNENENIDSSIELYKDDIITSTEDLQEIVCDHVICASGSSRFVEFSK